MLLVENQSGYRQTRLKTTILSRYTTNTLHDALHYHNLTRTWDTNWQCPSRRQSTRPLLSERNQRMDLRAGPILPKRYTPTVPRSLRRISPPFPSLSPSLGQNLTNPQLGGRIDPAFITSYNQIRASGITNIDGYFFPCTGSSHNCKSPQTQVNEIVNFLKANNILVKRLWLDLEPPSSGSPCKGWDYGATQNTALAKEFIAAIKATGLKWGIVCRLLLPPILLTCPL